MDKENFIRITQFHIDNHLKVLPESVLPNSLKLEENIYYVNGILTPKDKLDENVNIVRKYFNLKSSPYPIHNTTKGLAKDIAEGAKDYAWGSKFVLAGGSNNNPIPHEISIPILAILQAAKNRNLPIGISASSQGSLITTNCLLAFMYLSDENKTFLKKNVRVCHVGTVVHKSITDFLHFILNKYVTAVNPKDPIASYVGMHKIPLISTALFWANLINNKGKKYHGIEWYLPIDGDVIKYYDEKTKLDKDEPFVRKDFFTKPILHANSSEVNLPKNKWLEPFLNITMQG